jgi:hypothetical protein
VIGENVSHQHVPKKKTAPNTQPVTNDRMAESFSRSIATNTGMNAKKAVDHHSQPGKARISKIADDKASPAFCQEGKSFASRNSFTGLILAENLRFAA